MGDLDFTLSATQSLVGHTVHGVSTVEKHWENFTQKAYPLKYIRKMKKQLESIQDSVQAMGMKPDEREDWSGVRMQLIRIFQQEQFIFPKVDRNEEPTTSGLAFYGGTRDPNALVKRILFKINPTYEAVDHMGRQRTIRYDPGKISKNIKDYAHCVKIMHDRSHKKYIGFIQLKDYMKLSKVADILGAGHPTGGPVKRKFLKKMDCAIEACEVRGRTKEIFNGVDGAASIKKSKSDQGQTEWGASNDWFHACRSSSSYREERKTNWEPTFEYVKRFSGTTKQRYYSYDNEPCFNLVSGIMQAREDIWQKNSIRTLQNALEEEKKENRRNRAMVQDLYRLLVKKDILSDKASTASEESFMSTMTREEGELWAGHRIRQGEASPVDASNDGPMLG